MNAQYTPDVYTADDRPITAGGLVRLVVDVHEGAGSPLPPESGDDGLWSLYDFNARRDSAHRRSRDSFLDEYGNLGIGFRRRLQVGLAFLLVKRGDSWRIDSHSFDIDTAGAVLVWEDEPDYMGARSYEERQQDAQGGLNEYNAWADGQVWKYVIKDATGAELDKNGWLYGDYVKDEVKMAVDAEARGLGLGRVEYVTPLQYAKSHGRRAAGVLYVVCKGVGAYLFA